MKHFLLLTTLLFSLSMYVCSHVLADHEIPRGRQPVVSVDPKGVIRMAYGFQDSIYCVTSTNQGKTFSQPVLVAALPAMHLGMSRGPQLASSRNYSMVTAIDKQGTIHSYLLDHHLPGWKEIPPVNDVPGSAVEGLMSLTAAPDDWFYAVWLDVRQEQKNNIYTAAFHSKSNEWDTNQLAYRSPEGNVCECCRPTILYGDNKLVITFRNALDGSRDIYFAVSSDRGKKFGPAARMGKDTWVLNACPMDGGDVMLNDKGQVVSAWRRGSDIFYSVEGQQEQKISTGKTPTLVWSNGKPIIAWQENNLIKWVIPFGGSVPAEIGKGGFPTLSALPNGKILCAWEEDQNIKYKILSM